MKNNMRICALILISYLLGFIMYIPLYICLIGTFVVQIIAWIKIAQLTIESNNKITKKIVDILAFYKLVLSIIGYGLIELPDFLPSGHRVFTELSISFILTIFSTQIRPFEMRLAFYDFLSANGVLLSEIIISAIFSLGIICTYYYSKISYKRQIQEI